MKKIIFLAFLFISPALLIAEDITVRLSGMVCESCAQGLKETFEKMPEVQHANGNVEKQTLLIQTKAKMTLLDEKIKEEIVKAGYTPLSISRADSQKN